MKQETLEEGAERYFKKVSPNVCFYDAVKFGAKWQQERSYSEEEVKYILYSLKNYLGFGEEVYEKKWFEQFKKK